MTDYEKMKLTMSEQENAIIEKDRIIIKFLNIKLIHIFDEKENLIKIEKVVDKE